MRVLFVTHHYLHGNGGGLYASRAYINAFTEIADRITLLYPMKKGMDIEGISEKVEAIPVYNNKSKWIKFFDLLRGKVHRFNEAFRHYIKSKNYDLVVFDTSLVSFNLIGVAHKYGCKVITIHHNYQVEYYRDNLSWYLRGVVLYWTKRLEKEAVQNSDLNLTITEQDKKLLAENYNNGLDKNIDVLGCFEWKDRELNVAKNKENKYCFIITGNLSAVQTEQSLLPWLDIFYPIMKEVIPCSQLIIAGKSPSKNIQNKCKELNVKLHASPSNMQPLLDTADFYICPTNLGGGLKLRVMDGLKNGIPVITHEVSARGYEMFTEKGYLLTYNDIQSFRECLKILSATSYNRSDIQTLYNTTFTFKLGVERLQRIITSK